MTPALMTESLMTESLMTQTLMAEARGGFEAALAAAAPARVLAPAFAGLAPPPDAILAVGKAASLMAAACRSHGLTAPGVLITNPENAIEVEGFTLIEGGHPLPDEGSVKAAYAAMELAAKMKAGEHLLVLLSGGGSALMAAPIEPLTLAHKREINAALLASGMDIHRMNAARRLFSAVKGGRLAALAAPAQVTQWVLSDVAGDHLESIASGPFAPDPWPFAEAKACVSEAALDRYDWVREALAAMEAGHIKPPLRPGDAAFDHVETHILASNAICVEAAKRHLGRLGHLGHLGHLGADVQTLPPLMGEAAEMGQALARHVKATPPPLKAVGGGETVVTLPAKHGLGGRSQELALGFLLEMHNTDMANTDMLGAGMANTDMDWVLLAGGTDGRDGPTDAAGGLVSSAMVFDHQTARDARAALDAHDSYRFLESLGGLLKCPPTGTNLADIAIVLTAPRR